MFIRFGVIDENLKFFFEGLIIFLVILKKWLFIVDFEIFVGIICLEEYIVSYYIKKRFDLIF